MTLPAPVFTTAGSTDPHAPLVVLLHGIGETEATMQTLARSLPEVASYVALRAPYPFGRGHSWFTQDPLGHIDQDSFTAAIEWFTDWIDSWAGERPVLVGGFSAGAAMAGTLVLEQPQRYVGAALLSGALPLGPRGLAVPGRLTGLPVFLVESEQDPIIRAEYTKETWDYLIPASGAAVTARQDPGGHEVTEATASELGAWLVRRLRHLATVGRAPVGLPARVVWPTLPEGLPQRAGNRPLVTWAPPQQQYTDQSSDALHAALAHRLASLDGVEAGPSQVARGALALRAPRAQESPTAFVAAGTREFAHLHPAHDTALHVVLPMPLAADAVAKGWAQANPHAGTTGAPGEVLVYGPRTPSELETVVAIVEAARRTAVGA